VIASNIDKILGLADRYSKTNPEKVSGLKNEGKILIQKVLDADSFDKISQLEADFKKKITLPIYQMFTSDLRKSDIRMV
jgi:hypothetical protein